MKKKITLLLLLTFLSLTYGQTEFIKSEDNEAKRKINYALNTSILENGDIISLTIGKKQSQLSFKQYHTLSHYNKDMKLIKQKDISKEFKGSVMGFSVTNNRINIIVASPHELRMKSIKRYFCYIDDFSFEEQTLYKSSTKEASSLSFNKDYSIMSIIIGDRREKGFTVKLNKAKKLLQFDSDFELFSDIKLNDFYKGNKNINFNDIHTLDDGTAILLIKRYKNSKQSTCSHEIIRITKDSQDVFKIDTKNKYVEDLRAFINSDTIYFAGHYSEYAKEDEKKGFYISKLNLSDLKQESVNLSPFNSKYKDDINKQILRKKFKQLNHIEISDFFVIKDSYFMINETTYSNTMTAEQRGLSNGQSVTTFYYGNIGINKFDFNGNLIDYDIIYKEKPSNYFLPTASTSIKIKKNDKVFIYLNASKLENEDGEIYKYYKDRPYLCYEFKYDYSMNKQVNFQKDFFFRHINSFYYNNDYLILLKSKQNDIGIQKIIPN
jgi:hypothetical protein